MVSSPCADRRRFCALPACFLFLLPITLAGMVSPINPARLHRNSALAAERLALAKGAAGRHHGSNAARRNACGKTRVGKAGASMVTESDNIVAETAARIFGDLADPQTVNNARDAALEGAAVARAVAMRGLASPGCRRNCGGAGASLADGFAVARRRRPFCGAGAAGGDDDRRLAAGASRASKRRKAR